MALTLLSVRGRVRSASYCLRGLLAAVTLLASVGAQAARAAPSQVSVTCPSSPCSTSLIQSAIDSPSTAPGTTIVIGPGTYDGDLTIDKSVTLKARWVGVTLNGENSSTSPGATVTADAGTTATIDGLTITGGFGNSSAWGGGIRVAGATLTVSNSVVTGNTSDPSSGSVGGGVFNSGVLTVVDSVISQNKAGFGGGLDNDATLNMSGALVLDNTAGPNGNGGGLDNGIGAMTRINDSAFLGNTATGGSGGAIDDYHATLSISDSVLINNSSTYVGGGLYVWSGTAPPSISNDLIIGNTPDNCGGSFTC